MSGIEDILTALPINDIAQKLGVDPDTAARAVREGGATILGGLGRNAESPDGAAAIEQALSKHADARIDTADVDEEDGQKILSHIFGSDTEVVAQKLTNDGNTAGIDFGKLLPILAPIVMGLLAKGTQSQGQPQASEQGSGGGIGDIIGGLLGGLGGGSQQSSGGGLGDILGSLGGLFGKK